ncbi:MAG: hypothetical protein P1U87_12495 [Verrucomicrobiales bacterium]|nr:hypothetical protein [Verrucomicrobiales bacterium]
MTKTTLIVSHLVTLAVGIGISYVALPSMKSNSGSGSKGGAESVTTLSGQPSGVKGGVKAANMSAISLEQSGYQRGYEDPMGALAAAKDIPGRDNRLIYTESVYTAWGEKDGVSAAQWANDNLKGIEKSDALYNIADGWAEVDPEGAAKWFDENTSGINREDAIYEILEAWGRKSPEQALVWAEDLDDYTRSGVMDALAEGWAANDPEGAAKAVDGLLEYDFGDEFAMNVAGQWASTDPAAAASWAGTLENADARSIAFLEVGTEWALVEPDKATAWIDSLGSEEDKLYASLGVALGWSEHDPGNSLQWAVSNVENPNTRQRIIEDVMLDWSSNDPSSAAEWLNAQPGGPQNDEILSTFSSAIIDIDPQSAVTWASTISDEAKRSENVSMLLEEWIAMDGKRARRWVDNSGLDADTKARFGSQ